MNDMPKSIWASVFFDYTDPVTPYMWSTDRDKVGALNETAKYTRTDLAEAEIESLKAELEASRECHRLAKDDYARARQQVERQSASVDRNLVVELLDAMADERELAPKLRTDTKAGGYVSHKQIRSHRLARMRLWEAEKAIRDAIGGN